MKLGTVKILSVMVSKAPDRVKKDNLTKDMHPKLISELSISSSFSSFKKGYVVPSLTAITGKIRVMKGS